MGCGGSVFLGKDLLNIIESTSNNSSPISNEQRVITKEVYPKPPSTTVNNIIINNYNGNVLKNITNIEPYASQMHRGNSCLQNQNTFNENLKGYNLAGYGDLSSF
jgi:hypothetical protein